MQKRLLSFAVVLLALYLAFGGYLQASMTMTPENLVSDLGQSIVELVTSAKQMIFG